MATRKLEKQQWHAFFDRVTKMLEGKQTEIEVASLRLGDQIGAHWLPLVSPMIPMTISSKWRSRDWIISLRGRARFTSRTVPMGCPPSKSSMPTT